MARKAEIPPEAAILRRLGFQPDGRLDLDLLGLSPEAIEARRRFIGGSDATIIASGKTAEIDKLRAFKRGGPATVLREIPVLMGLYTEPLNIALTEKILGGQITRRGERVYSPRRPFMACTLDGWYDGMVVQAKHVVGWSKMHEVAQKYLPQLHHEMLVTGAETAILAVLFGNLNHDILRVEFDPLFAGRLVDMEEAFWASVGDGMPVEAAPPIVAPDLTPPPPVEIDMAGNNAFADAASRYLGSRDAAALYGQAETDLKGLIPDGATRAYGFGVEVRRSRNGARRVVPLQPEEKINEA